MAEAGVVGLRALAREDFPSLHTWYQDPELIRHLGTPFRFRTFEEASGHMASWLHPAGETFRMVVTLDGRPIGLGKIDRIDRDHRNGMFHMLIGEASLRGKGIGTKAAGLIIDHGFRDLGLRRLDLELLATNRAALALYLKCGFVQEGVRRKAVLKDRTWIDVIVMGLLAEDWNAGTEK